MTSALMDSAYSHSKASMADVDRQNLPRRYHLCNNIDAKSVCIVCEEIRQLESGIRETEDHLLALKDRHHDLASKFNTAHDPITQKLPVELISRIFMFYAPTSTLQNANITLSLGSICHAWRQIAWSTPRLWIFCNVNVFGKGGSQVRRNAVDVVKQWFERSGQLPLSIMLHNSQLPLPNSDLTESHSMIEVTNQHSGRWNFLDMKLSPELMVTLKGMPNNPSTLRTLELGLQKGDNASTGMLFQLYVKPSPAVIRLRYIRLKSVDISWNFVVRMSLTGPRLDECIEIIRQAPCLTFCEIRELYETGENYALPQITVTHSSIQALAIMLSLSSQLFEFLDRVSFPALKYLHLINAMGSTGSIPSFIVRSACQSTLVKFILRHTFETDDIIPLLRQMPALQELRLMSSLPNGRETDCFNNLFALISASAPIKPGEPGSFLPKLERLAIVAPRCFSWKSVPLLASHHQSDTSQSESQDIVGYRRPLKSLVFHLQLEQGLTDYIDRDDIPGLLRLIQQGISLEIETFEGHRPEREDLLKLSIAFHGLSSS